MDIKPKSFKNDYETTFILTPDLPENELHAAVEKYVSLIKDHGGEIINIERWGMIKLAYEIANRTTGYFTFIEFSGPGDYIAKLDQEFRYDERVIRHLTVRLDKHALAYNKKRREQGFGFRKDLMASNA